MKDLADKADPRARIPSINILAARVRAAFSGQAPPRPVAIQLARYVAESLRREPAADVDALIHSLILPLREPGPRPVINATGILLHTNLGRAPLAEMRLAAALGQVAGYTDLELDLASGKRGHRDRHFAALARLVWQVEDATLVNNAAAAVCLALTAIAGKGETLVSRGELIEIGGSFRLPDIMNMAGTKLIEVGTTNKTKLPDYARAITADTACLLKTHTSNYRIEGFCQEVPLVDLVALGRQHRIPVMMDLGSGLSRSLAFPATGEPFIEDYLETDPDLLIFSGDKLFGSVQAGIVLGKKSCIDRLRRHPMMRLLRCDKLTIAIICHQLRDTLMGEASPLSLLAGQTQVALRKRASAIARALEVNAEVVAGEAFVGGGSLPQERRPSICLAFDKPAAFAKRLRLGVPSVVGYLRDGRFFLNLASVLPEQDEALIAALNNPTIRGAGQR